MTALIIIAIILLVLTAIAMIKFGVSVTYAEKDLCVKAIAGPLKITVYPMRKKEKLEKKKKYKKKEKVKNKPEGDKPAEPKNGGTIDTIRQIIPPVLDALGRLRRKLSIDLLTIHYTAAAPDPYSAAMSFGHAAAAVGIVMPLLENTFKIKKSDVGTDVTFDSEENIIYVDVQLSLAFWEIIYIGLALLPLLKTLGQKPDTGKVENNGQASD